MQNLDLKEDMKIEKGLLGGWLAEATEGQEQEIGGEWSKYIV
jgi:hypothetical protein